MEQSMLARCVTCVLTAHVSSFTSLRLCPPLHQIKTESLWMSPKDSLVNMEDKLSSTFSRWDLGAENSAHSLSPGTSAPWLCLQPVGMAGPYTGFFFQAFLPHLSQFTLAFLLRLFCSCAWWEDLTFKSHSSHLKQNQWASQVKAPSTQTEEKQKIKWRRWVGRSKG